MVNKRGRPLPWSIRERIQELRSIEDPWPYRAIASHLQISKTTVQKYGRKFGTKLLIDK